MPFWFWNDDLSDKEILRQIADFDAHGVYGFVIHPRVGLPRSIEFMSDAMLRFMDVAIREAVKRDMKVILYDEGMYPSGSASGQVVATNPQLACRCLAMKELTAAGEPELPAGQNLVATLTTAAGKRIAVIDRKVDSTIRGLHYIGEGPKEDVPPAGDILNPETAKTILHLVHEKYHAAFKEHFGKTIIAVFTDAPNPLGRVREKNVKPGTITSIAFSVMTSSRIWRRCGSMMSRPHSATAAITIGRSTDGLRNRGISRCRSGAAIMAYCCAAIPIAGMRSACRSISSAPGRTSSGDSSSRISPRRLKGPSRPPANALLPR